MKKVKLFVLFLLTTSAFTACDNDDNQEAAKPTAQNIEIGTANNKRALIGRDFHFNADVVAGDKIADVQLKILPKSGETYVKDWKLEFKWPEYVGTKNTNVHKHFTILLSWMRMEPNSKLKKKLRLQIQPICLLIR
jgi:hypothetical protein